MEAQPFPLFCVPEAEALPLPEAFSVTGASISGPGGEACALVVGPAGWRGLSPEEYQAFLTVGAPFDAIQAGQFFAYGFGVVVGCWVIAHTAGLVVRAVRGF